MKPKYLLITAGIVVGIAASTSIAAMIGYQRGTEDMRRTYDEALSKFDARMAAALAKLEAPQSGVCDPVAPIYPCIMSATPD